MITYHKDIGFPESLIIPKDIILKLRYTNHAKERMERDNYKLIVIPSVVKLTTDNVIEAYTEDNINLKKILIRVSYDRNRDIVLVLQPEFKKSGAKVITFWLNNKKDNHSSTDKTKYTKP